jgi:flagellar biosynthesis GTPase FlhF
VYRTIYAIEPEQENLVFSPVRTIFEVNGPAGRRRVQTTKQEKLAFSPVKTIFEMSEFIKDKDASEGPDQMTQLLLDWMKRSEERQAAAEQKERERDETLQRIRDEQKRHADRLADLARQKTVSHAEAEKKKAELDRIREDELNEMMARHRMFYEEAGLEVPETLLVATSGRTDSLRHTDKESKAEYVKPSLVGYLDPMAPQNDGTAKLRMVRILTSLTRVG